MRNRCLSIVALLIPLLVFGCGGVEPASGDMSEAAHADLAGESGGGDMSLLPLFAACTANGQCASDLCTQTSYDRSPTPLCTYACDANDMNPKCPNGCNPKGFCKM